MGVSLVTVHNEMTVEERNASVWIRTLTSVSRVMRSIIKIKKLLFKMRSRTDLKILNRTRPSFEHVSDNQIDKSKRRFRNSVNKNLL